MECKGESSIITFVNFCISKYRHKHINKDKINDKKIILLISGWILNI